MTLTLPVAVISIGVDPGVDHPRHFVDRVDDVAVDVDAVVVVDVPMLPDVFWILSSFPIHVTFPFLFLIRRLIAVLLPSFRSTADDHKQLVMLSPFVFCCCRRRFGAKKKN